MSGKVFRVRQITTHCLVDMRKVYCMIMAL